MVATSKQVAKAILNMTPYPVFSESIYEWARMVMEQGGSKEMKTYHPLRTHVAGTEDLSMVLHQEERIAVVPLDQVDKQIIKLIDAANKAEHDKLVVLDKLETARARIKELEAQVV